MTNTPDMSLQAVERMRERIREVVDEDGGCWSPCSGCQESVDGYVSVRDYPWSDLFRCQPGGGCHECGGIGVLWQDGAFLASYGAALEATPSLHPSEGEGLVKRIARALCMSAGDDPDREGPWDEWWAVSAYAKDARAVLAALTPSTVTEGPVPDDGWRPMESAPRDGTHILVSFADQYTATWGPNQSSPVVAHWFDDGFYLSSGIIQGSTNDQPLHPKRWMGLGFVCGALVPNDVVAWLRERAEEQDQDWAADIQEGGNTPKPRNYYLEAAEALTASPKPTIVEASGMVS